MDLQLIFLLLLALSILIKGVFSLNIVLQLMGIVIVLFLIYDYCFNYKEKQKYKRMHSGGGSNFFGLIGIFGHLDLVLGILLLIKGTFGIIPMWLLSLFVILIFFKALPFVFGGDIASVLDIIFSILIFSAYIIPNYIFIVIAVYFIQKGLLSYL